VYPKETIIHCTLSNLSGRCTAALFLRHPLRCIEHPSLLHMCIVAFALGRVLKVLPHCGLLQSFLETPYFLILDNQHVTLHAFIRSMPNGWNPCQPKGFSNIRAFPQRTRSKWPSSLCESHFCMESLAQESSGLVAQRSTDIFKQAVYALSPANR